MLRKRDLRKRLSVIHLITSLDVGGAEVMLLKLLSRMNVDRFENHVICLAEEGPVGQKIAAFGIPVYALNMRNERVKIHSLMGLHRLIRQIQPDILQTWMYHANLLGALVGKWCHSTLLCWNIRCSNIDLNKYGLGTRITVKLCSMLSFLPKVIIANSKDGMRYHKRMGYRTKRWEVIPNGFDFTVYKPDDQAKSKLAHELGLDPGTAPIFIGYIARFDPMKDHTTFLKAAFQLLRQRNDVHFVLAGRKIDWNNRELAERIPRAFITNFHLLGDRDDIEKITAALDIACSVSLGEGFSNVIGEAMACGVPCVVTDVGDSAFIVGDTGLVVPPRDPVALLDAWNRLLHMATEDRRALGLTARRRIASCFSIEKIAGRYESLYCELDGKFNPHAISHLR